MNNTGLLEVMELRPEITENLIQLKHDRENLFSQRATKNDDYLRRKNYKRESHLRLPFSRDADRILHSMAYTRYIDKTQVFYLVTNDHITHRVLHVQLVSKIARTIGRALRLNEDLIEAIALGHDIGHVPYGHFGESILDELCKKYNIGRFFHNAQAIQFLDVIEDKDLTIQVLDGILCHNGEVHNRSIVPQGEGTWDSFDEKLERIRNGEDKSSNIMPMTYEGCVVRFADNIAYLGRDLQDSIEIGLLDEAKLSEYWEICDDLFPLSDRDDLNWIIIERLVKDLINNSDDADEISFSKEASLCVQRLKELNYEYIYTNHRLHQQDDKIGRMFDILFEHFLREVEDDTKNSRIHTDMTERQWISESYKESVENNSIRPAELVRDYLAGMTDRYFHDVFRELVVPTKIQDFRTEQRPDTGDLS